MYSYGMSLAAENGNDSLGPAWGAAGGTFGTVASITVAMLFMMFVYTTQKSAIRRQMRRDHSGKTESSKAIYRTMMLTIVPIVLSALIYNISNVADQGIFNKALLGQGYTESQYGTIWGIYSGQLPCPDECAAFSGILPGSVRRSESDRSNGKPQQT